MTRLIDTSVFSGSWPFRAPRERTPAALKAHLQPLGVTQAWVASAEAILFPDPMQANEPLAEAVAGDGFFLPVATIDPTLATARRDARTCLERLGFGALKLAPNYHQYVLADARVAELVALASERDVPLCVQLRMMDERSHHPLMKVPGVPVEEVVALAQRHPEARFLVCGSYGQQLRPLRDAANVWAEISFVESGQALAGALEALGPDRLVFASHSPLFYFEAEAAKLDVAAEDVPATVLQAVRSTNAQTLLGRTRPHRG
jgi:predicted TIM-barrel fold metal-dependent hydrolase